MNETGGEVYGPNLAPRSIHFFGMNGPAFE